MILQEADTNSHLLYHLCPAKLRTKTTVIQEAIHKSLSKYIKFR